MPSKEATATAASWDDHHTKALTRGIISLVLQHRPDLYAIDELQEVSNNGGDRINKKIQQILRKLTEGVPGGETMVKDEVAKGGRSKQVSNGNGSTSTQSTPKKRKVKDETDEE